MGGRDIDQSGLILGCERGAAVKPFTGVSVIPCDWAVIGLLWELVNHTAGKAPMP